MRKLSDFKDEQAIIVVANLIEPILEIFANQENKKLGEEKNGFKMFSTFLSNSPGAMMKIFAILNEENPETYHCDGVDVAKNLMEVISDNRLIELFISQGQKGDAKSSASALVNTEE